MTKAELNEIIKNALTSNTLNSKNFLKLELRLTNDVENTFQSNPIRIDLGLRIILIFKWKVYTTPLLKSLSKDSMLLLIAWSSFLIRTNSL